MEVDVSTLQDLSIIHADEEQSLLKRLDYCYTNDGRKRLEYLFRHPHTTIAKIKETELVLSHLRQHLSSWPATISNGTIQMIDQFYAYPLGTVPTKSILTVGLYQLIHRNEYAMIRFSFRHFLDFLYGMNALVHIYNTESTPQLLNELLNKVVILLQAPEIKKILETKNKKDSSLFMLRSIHFLFHHYRHSYQQLKELFSQLDAWQSMATAMKERSLHFPVWSTSESPLLEVDDLKHLLLAHPVGYTISFDEQSNFLFLTGANMAGKSTFIKAIGSAVYLAHLGMGSPARSMKLSLFEGIISNIQIQDNLPKGESFFYNEVQRIKTTLSKIADGRRWLVLIDELFKGTNIQDSMLCSKTVIEGLAQCPNSIFILSTHYYEIGNDLKFFKNLMFRYFETIRNGDEFAFNYQLKEGISDDRFGYLILKKEKIPEMIAEITGKYKKKAP